MKDFSKNTFRLNLNITQFIRSLLSIIFSISCLIINAQNSELVIPGGHTDDIYSISINTPKNLLLTSGNDHSIKLWNLSSGALLRTINGHSYYVKDAFFINNGEQILSYSGDYTAKIWETSNGNLIKCFDGHEGVIFSACISKDNNTLYTASEDSTIKIWNIKTGMLIKTLFGHKGPIYNIIINQKTNQLISSSEDHNIFIWDLQSGTHVKSLSGHRKGVLFTKLICNGKYIISSSWDNSAIVWDSNTGSKLFELKGHNKLINDIVAIPESEIIITASEDSQLKFWNLKNGAPIKTEIEHTQAIQKIAIDTVGKTFTTVANDSCAIVWSFKTLKPLYKYKGHLGPIYTVAYEDSSRLVTGSGDNNAIKWSIDNSEKAISFGGGKPYITYLKTNSLTNTILSYSNDKKIRIWDLMTGTLKRIIGSNTNPINAAVITEDFEKIIAVENNNIILIYDFHSIKPIYSAELLNKSPVRQIIPIESKTEAIIIHVDNSIELYNYFQDTLIVINSNSSREKVVPLCSANSKYIAISNLNEISIYDHNSKSFTKKFKANCKNIISLKFNPVSDQICLTTDKGFLVYNYLNGTLIFKSDFESEWYYEPEFNSKGSVLFTATWDGGAKLWSTTDYNSDIFFSDSSWSIHSARFSPNDSFLIFTTYDKRTYLYDINSKKKINRYEGYLKEIDWASNILITYNNSGLIVSNLKSGKELFKWYILDSTDYLTINNSYLFDGTSSAMNKIYFVQDLDIVNVSQLKDRFYEPDLWSRSLKLEKLRHVENSDFKIDLPPSVGSIIIDSIGNLNIDITDLGGGIGKVQVYINKKEISYNQSVNNFNIKDHPYLIQGDTNIISVQAYNKDNWIISEEKSIFYMDKRSKSISNQDLYFISIGISDYSGNLLDLKFASKDAEDMYKAIQIGANRLFGITQTHSFLLNSSASEINLKPNKTNIKNIFDSISHTATSDDLILIYLSGHGISWGGDDGDFYFLTQEASFDLSDKYNDEAIRTKSGISSKELTDWIKAIPALKQVLIIDACASGRVVEDLITQRTIPSNTIRSLDRMKDRTGLHIITGCAADATSYEASRYGQGVLTYSLLEGMKGLSLRENEFVDISRWFQYARDRVPILASGIGGIQEPQIISPNGGESFDIGQLLEEDKINIPLNTIKPIYIRSNFQDEDIIDDILKLGDKIDDALNEYSSKGNSSTIIFVDVKEFPNAYKIIGRYKRDLNKITVKIIVKQGEDILGTVDLVGSNENDIILQLMARINYF
jgi:WD40 repeat protein